MNIFNNYFNNIILFDFITKFKRNSINELPILKKLILSFEYKKPTLRKILMSLLSLKLINGRINRNGKITLTKQSNISLKLRAGNPVGCKLTLRKKDLLNFLYKFLLIVLPSDKSFIKIKKISHINMLSLQFGNLFLFQELSSNYHIFKELNKLSIVLVITNCKSIEELIFILKSFKIQI